MNAFTQENEPERLCIISVGESGASGWGIVERMKNAPHVHVESMKKLPLAFTRSSKVEGGYCPSNRRRKFSSIRELTPSR